MNPVAKREPLPVNEYLEGELRSQDRHEYVAGAVYAMAGASEEHNLIVGNVYVRLRAWVGGRSCRVFMSDMKLRLQSGQDEIFYYPDLMVVCDPRDSERYFKRNPRVIVEVLSPETERIDRREKFHSYTSVGTLQEYVLVAQDQCEVTIYRRDSGWKSETLTAPDARLTIPSLDFSIPLLGVYEGVVL